MIRSRNAPAPTPGAIFCGHEHRRRFVRGRWSPAPVCFPELWADEGLQAPADRAINPFGVKSQVGRGLGVDGPRRFCPIPAFEAFPYDGYSKDHMDGKHYVCRGGSWASARRILRCSFRNWYVPTYRQGFLGVRCARWIQLNGASASDSMQRSLWPQPTS